MEQRPYFMGWDGYLSGHITCSCGRKTTFTVYALKNVTCGGCGTVYTVTLPTPSIVRAPEKEQTGHPDLLGHLEQRLEQRPKKDPPQRG